MVNIFFISWELLAQNIVGGWQCWWWWTSWFRIFLATSLAALGGSLCLWGRTLSLKILCQIRVWSDWMQHHCSTTIIYKCTSLNFCFWALFLSPRFKKATGTSQRAKLLDTKSFLSHHMDNAAKIVKRFGANKDFSSQLYPPCHLVTHIVNTL